MAEAQLSYGNLYYEVTNGAVTITGSTCPDGAVTIPSQIDGLPVTTIGKAAFENCSGLTAVAIASSVTAIGERAFNSCYRLTNATIPDRVTAIGDGAFAACTALNNISIPDSITSIGDYAFAGCILSTVTIPSALTNIGNGFAYCRGTAWIAVNTNNFTYSSVAGVLFNKHQTTLIQYPEALEQFTYTIPNTVTAIGDSAFNGCEVLRSVTIPNSVTNIGANAFAYSPSLEAITIPNSVTSIRDHAFAGCVFLTNVTIGSGVLRIGEGLFDDSTRLATVAVDASNSAYSSADGVLFNKSLTTLIQYPQGLDGFSYAIPNHVTSLGDHAFYNCPPLTNITIGSGVTNVGEGAFDYCRGLSAITVDASNSAYASADGVLFDKNQTTLMRCPGATIGNYTVPTGVTSIGGHAFYACYSLTGVWLGKRVTNIGEAAFFSDSGLLSINVDGDNENYSAVNGVLFDKRQTTLIQYPGGAAGDYAIPDGVTSIGADAFHPSYNLTTVTIPKSVISIGERAFLECYALTEVYFQGNAPSPGDDLIVFQGRSPPATAYYLPGTTGWGATFGGLRTAPWTLPYPLILANSPTFGVQSNGFGFIVSWATNLSVVVEASPSPSKPTWSPVATNTLSEGSWYFSDPQWTNHPARFYRVRSR